jgi:hypothetical protein
VNTEFIETVRAKTGQRVTIRVSEVATLTECAHNTSCLVTKRGDAFHVAPPYDDMLKVLLQPK